MNDFEKAICLLKKNEQYKILKELEKNKNKDLIQQILNIDFEKISRCKSKIGIDEEFKNEQIENIPCIDEKKLSVKEKQKYENIAENIISSGKYAVVTMAGGQRYKAWI